MAKNRVPYSVACSNKTRIIVSDEIAVRGLAAEHTFMKLYWEKDDTLPLGLVQYKNADGEVVETYQRKIRT